MRHRGDGQSDGLDVGGDHRIAHLDLVEVGGLLGRHGIRRHDRIEAQIQGRGGPAVPESIGGERLEALDVEAGLLVGVVEGSARELEFAQIQLLPGDVDGLGRHLEVRHRAGAHFADGERLFRSIVIGRFGDRERSGATPVSLFL